MKYLKKTKKLVQQNFKYVLPLLIIFALYVVINGSLEKHSQPLILVQGHSYIHNLRKHNKEKEFMENNHAKKHGWDSSLFAGNFVDPNNTIYIKSSTGNLNAFLAPNEYKPPEFKVYPEQAIVAQPTSEQAII